MKLSNKNDRYFMIQRILEKMQKKGIEECIIALERYFEDCYGCKIPNKCEEQINMAIRIMEEKWNNTSQIVRRKSMGMDGLHFYQVICFSPKELLICGKTFFKECCSMKESYFSVQLCNLNEKDAFSFNDFKDYESDLFKRILKKSQILMKSIECVVYYQFVFINNCIIVYDIREFYAIDNISLDYLNLAHKMKKISDAGLIQHVTQEAISDCLSSRFTETEEEVLAYGSSISQGVACGYAIFGNENLEHLRSENKHYILVKNELTPMDLEYIYLADGIITGKCSSTSHQCLIANQLGKVFLFECEDLKEEENGVFLKSYHLNHTDELSIEGKTGYIYHGNKKIQKNHSGIENCKYLLDVCKKHKKIDVLVNTEDSDKLQEFELICYNGIGLYRTEYMSPQNKLKILLQEAMIANDYEVRISVIRKLQSVWEEELFKVYRATDTKEITIRTLDYPSHELLFDVRNNLTLIASDINMSIEDIDVLIAEKQEKNGMLGNRGCRFAVFYPEIFEAQIHAIFHAYLSLSHNERPVLKLMFPMIADMTELMWMKNKLEKIVNDNYQHECIEYKLGIMIETPRSL